MLVVVFMFFLPIIVHSSPDFLKELPPALKDEVNLTVPEIVAKYNYSVEVHNVITEDGYVLTLHRILPKKRLKGTVLIMHGILASSADWIITGPHHGFGYILSDHGYDVWLGNARGNRYSKHHTILKPQEKEFWNFSWHEIGIYDLPAIIDYIINSTRQNKIFYIGHSQGTTAFYVMCTMKPEYNMKIRAQFSLAPVGYVSHMFSPIFHLIATQDILIENFVNFVNMYEVLPTGGLISTLGKNVCGENAIAEILCRNTLFAICGFNLKQLNTTILPLILAHIPAGCSSKQLLHYSQGINSGHFRQYDYGFFGNLRRYSTWKPPEYNLSEITVPMYFFYSENDWISSSRDVNILAKKIKNLKGKFLVTDWKFDHMDYLFAIQAPQLVYNKVISLMTRH